ncbi:hypothetical protein Tco_0348866 [Tanacetum coccineum]
MYMVMFDDDIKQSHLTEPPDQWRVIISLPILLTSYLNRSQDRAFGLHDIAMADLESASTTCNFVFFGHPALQVFHQGTENISPYFIWNLKLVQLYLLVRASWTSGSWESSHNHALGAALNPYKAS